MLTLEITKKILKWKPDLANEVDENGWSPFHYASYLGNITIFRQLLEKSDKSVVYLRIKDGKNKTALHIAASQGHMDVVKELVLHYPDCCEQVDDDGNNALHLVMKSTKDYFSINFLVDNQWLSSREFINEMNDKGNTPLHLLAHSQIYGSLFLSYTKVDKMTFNNENLNAMDIILSAKDLHGNKVSFCTLWVCLLLVFKNTKNIILMLSENSSYSLSFVFFAFSISFKTKIIANQICFLILVVYENGKHFSKTVNKPTLYFPTMFPFMCVIIIQQGLFNQISGSIINKLKKCQG